MAKDDDSSWIRRKVMDQVEKALKDWGPQSRWITLGHRSRFMRVDDKTIQIQGVVIKDIGETMGTFDITITRRL